MIDIKVVGPGCGNCQRLEALCKEVVAETGLEANIEKVTDWKQFADLGILWTPGLVINGEVKVSGKIPVKTTLTHWIQDAVNGKR